MSSLPGLCGKSTATGLESRLQSVVTFRQQKHFGLGRGKIVFWLKCSENNLNKLFVNGLLSCAVIKRKIQRDGPETGLEQQEDSTRRMSVSLLVDCVGCLSAQKEKKRRHILFSSLELLSIWISIENLYVSVQQKHIPNLTGCNPVK